VSEDENGQMPWERRESEVRAEIDERHRARRRELEQARLDRWDRQARSYAWIDKAYPLFLVAVIAAGLASCARGALVNDSDAQRAATTLGFTNPAIVHSTWFWPGLEGCDSGDAKAVTLDATNPTGQQVQVVACSGWPLKGWTVRVK
jgi:hypothetical protein